MSAICVEVIYTSPLCVITGRALLSRNIRKVEEVGEGETERTKGGGGRRGGGGRGGGGGGDDDV